MDNTHVSKKTMGRRKIEIKKIEKKTSLQVAFTKRRRGLFRKASELSVLCGAEIAILVQSPAEKIFAFGHPSVESLINRFQMGEAMTASSFHGEEIILPEGGTRSKYEESLIDCFQRGEALWPEMAASSSHGGQIIIREDGRSKYEEAVRRLEMEKRRTEEKEREFWWDQSYEGLELHELEEYVEALEVLRDNVSQRVEEMEKLMKLEGGLGSTPSNQELSASASASSNLLALPNHDQPVDYDLFDLIH